MELSKTNTSKNVVELRKELDASGVGLENVYIDGQKICCLGYTSERDKTAALKAIQTAVDSSETITEAINKLMVNANLTDHEVVPDEEIEINGVSMFINYAAKTVYDCNGEEVVNCKELECELPPEACKTILMQKVELEMQKEDEDNLW